MKDIRYDESFCLMNDNYQSNQYFLILFSFLHIIQTLDCVSMSHHVWGSCMWWLKKRRKCYIIFMGRLSGHCRWKILHSRIPCETLREYKPMVQMPASSSTSSTPFSLPILDPVELNVTSLVTWPRITVSGILIGQISRNLVSIWMMFMFTSLRDYFSVISILTPNTNFVHRNSTNYIVTELGITTTHEGLRFPEIVNENDLTFWVKQSPLSIWCPA